MRRLAPDEAALWKRVIASVKPIGVRPVAAVPVAEGAEAPAKPVRPRKSVPPQPLPAKEVSRKVEVRAESATLDASWDRRLGRGLVAPESTVDLHGHSLTSAYDRLDFGLEHAISRGDRVLLLITGKPPRAESERPHARGAIRAAVGDWLAASRHADRIAAVRGAHPRHGGNGALYIVLRRNRSKS
jgi:DNA-nicking Smr family endonuclease